MMELLAPAGTYHRMETALHFGADAVYLGGKHFGLRAYSDNFEGAELERAVKAVHGEGRKLYVTVNIFARNADLAELSDYLQFLQGIGADGAIVSDPGVIAVAKRVAPRLALHLSTQANTTNAESAQFWVSQGIKRIVLARELSYAEIAGIKQAVGESAEIEVFVHGAMCISYSGRCLLSNYLAGRESNRGECVQACRWEYRISEVSKADQPLTVAEDEHGTYLLNSRDLCLLPYLDLLEKAGVSSLKIEGRMKSEYYVATVVNAYRRALTALQSGERVEDTQNPLLSELNKTSHRNYTSGFFLGNNSETENFETSKSGQEYAFAAEVVDFRNGILEVEQRNRFACGDTLEILSPGPHFGKRFLVRDMRDAEGNSVTDAKLVQQHLFLPLPYALAPKDILRKEVKTCSDKPKQALGSVHNPIGTSEAE